MGLRGPMPKHPDRRQRRNVELSVVEGGGMVAPVYGRGWLKVTRAGWDAFWGSPLACSVAEKDVAALTRLFDMRNMYERMARMVAKEPIVVGSRDQLVLNPAARLMTQLMGEVRQLEREFGLTPDSGARMVAVAARASKSVDELVAAGDDELQVIDVDA